MMHPNQMAAYEALCMIVESNGGDCDDIERRNQDYFWTAPDGRVARISWDEPDYQLAAVRRGQQEA